MEKKTDSNRKSSPEISFRPVTEGLGFHPFSDGLPYAPIAKNPTGQKPPAGASVAGPVRVAPSITGKAIRPENPVPQISVPVAKPSLPIPGGHVPAASVPSSSFPSHLQPQPQVQTPSPTQSVTARSLPPALAQTVEEESFGLLYLLKRVVAYSLDFGFSLSLCMGVLSGLVWFEDMNLDLFSHSSILILMGFVFMVFHWLFVMVQEVSFKSSLGKRMFGLTLQGSRPVLFLRAFFFVPSISFLGMGLLWSLFDRQGCCWHDRVVGVQPREIARL